MDFGQLPALQLQLLDVGVWSKGNLQLHSQREAQGKAEDQDLGLLCEHLGQVS